MNEGLALLGGGAIGALSLGNAVREYKLSKKMYKRRVRNDRLLYGLGGLVALNYLNDLKGVKK